MDATNLRRELLSWFSEAEYVDRERFRWGSELHANDPMLAVSVRASSDLPPLVTQTSQRLYERLYLRDPFAGAPLPPDRLVERGFARALESARATGAARAGVGSPRNGTTEVQPGWYVAAGVRDPVVERAPLVRVYWNVCKAGAPFLALALAEKLGAAQTSYRFKLVADPRRYGRADAGVLYLHAREWSRAQAAVGEAHLAVARYLREGSPLFTKPLLQGVAVAEDPGNGESFGGHRSRLLSEALWDAMNARAASPAAKWDALAARFRREGLTLEAPHLAAGGFDSYEPPVVALPSPGAAQEAADA